MVGASYDASVYWVPLIEREQYYNADWLKSLKLAVVTLNILAVLNTKVVPSCVFNLTHDLRQLGVETVPGSSIP